MFNSTIIKKSYIVKILFIGLFFVNSIKSADFQLKPDNGNITFDVTHIGKTVVYGEFKEFDGVISLEDNKLTKAYGKISIESIETNNKIRNAYLKSKQFFDAKAFPYMYFYSQSFERVDDKILANGQLNIYGVSQNIQIELFHDQDTHELNSQTTLNRFDYNLRRHKRMIGATVNVQLNLKLPDGVELH